MNLDDSARQIDSELLKRFKIIHMIGKGNYSIIWKAFDKNLNELVALKKMAQGFIDSTMAQRTFREICFLHQMQGWDQIVDLITVFPNSRGCDLYVSLGILESDLRQILQTNRLEEMQKSYITFQLVYAINYLHTRQLIHRDLKPSNILINSDCTIKLSDFGLALTPDEGDTSKNLLSQYITDDSYRSPEMLFSMNKYNEGIDVWSLGCIVAEMYYGKPFITGENVSLLLNRIISITGHPEDAYVDTLSPYAKTLFNAMKDPKKEKISNGELAKVLPNAPSNARDFILQCLEFDPDKRISSKTLLSHPYIQRFITREVKEKQDAIPKTPIKYPSTTDYFADDFRKKIFAEFADPPQE